jgi:hypothetical protein
MRTARVVALLREKEKHPSALPVSTLCAEVNRTMGWHGFSNARLFCERGLIANREYWDYLGIKLSSRRKVGYFARTKR